MQNTSNLTVLILAAGYGRRMGPFSRMINKALVPYNNKPLISHIMAKFPVDSRFVIACGHLGQQLKDYVSIVHADKDITFVDMASYNPADTGPGTGIRECAKYVGDKFMWISCDTLFDFDYTDKLDHNWIAVHPVDSSISADYLWVRRNNVDIVSTHNKVKSSHAVDAFIGLMYVNDSRYIENLNIANAKEVGAGFCDINLKAYSVSDWKDFGTYEKWIELNKESDELSFHKPDELFYSDNGRIVKFTTDANLARLRYDRAYLNPRCMPANVSYAGNFLVYDLASGNTLYNCLSPQTFVQFLIWAEENLWVGYDSTSDTFPIADSFYRQKTLNRLSQFRIKYNTWEELAVVNETPVKSINEYISEIDFAWLASETVWCFTHGDMQFDNIIFDSATEKFTAIDWRTDFAGSLYGDLYYDLAKMLGGLYLSYKYVKEDKLTYTDDGTSATISIISVPDLNIYVSILKEWATSKNLSWEKIETLVPIIYLNMAPLHDAPFDKYLIALAQLHFSKL